MSENRLTVLIFILVLTLISLVSIECNRKPAPTNLLTRNFPRKYRSNSYDSFLELLNPILIERVSGTPGNTKVRNYLASKMKEYGCIVDLHDFTDNTPLGVRNFSNVIATYPVGSEFSENAKYTANRMIFACHYDSKYFDSIKFVGATDSAVPCAILLDMAKFFHENVDQTKLDRVSRHVQFIFFDGEEAFKEWSSTDSLYGSRRLAYDLKQQYGQRAFSSMDLFVLLDLLGGDNTEMLNYFPHNSFSNLGFHVLSMIEKKLIGHNMLSTNKPRYFRDLDGVGQYYPMQDDHIPFLQENVPILHLIPFPFPTTWHTANDNLDNIIPGNVQDLRLIMKWFLIEMIHKSNSDEENVQGQVNDKYKDEF